MEKKQTAVDYTELVAEELRLNGIENVMVNGSTINITSLGVFMNYNCLYNPNIMADVYRCLSNLGLRVHNEHLKNKIQSINTFNYGKQTNCG
jgi:hypothetical protein